MLFKHLPSVIPLEPENEEAFDDLLGYGELPSLSSLRPFSVKVTPEAMGGLPESGYVLRENDDYMFTGENKMRKFKKFGKSLGRSYRSGRVMSDSDAVPNVSFDLDEVTDILDGFVAEVNPGATVDSIDLDTAENKLIVVVTDSEESERTGGDTYDVEVDLSELSGDFFVDSSEVQSGYRKQRGFKGRRIRSSAAAEKETSPETIQLGIKAVGDMIQTVLHTIDSGLTVDDFSVDTEKQLFRVTLGGTESGEPVVISIDFETGKAYTKDVDGEDLESTSDSFDDDLGAVGIAVGASGSVQSSWKRGRGKKDIILSARERAMLPIPIRPGKMSGKKSLCSSVSSRAMLPIPIRPGKMSGKKSICSSVPARRYFSR